MEKAKRIEYRAPDPSANPYLTFTSMLMAAMDGITKKMEPAAHVDENIYRLDKEKELKIGEVARRRARRRS